MHGPGKYDDLCTDAREAAEATGAMLIIIDGREGPGFSVQAPAAVLRTLPGILRFLAARIEDDIKAQAH